MESASLDLMKPISLMLQSTRGARYRRVFDELVEWHDFPAEQDAIPCSLNLTVHRYYLLMILSQTRLISFVDPRITVASTFLHLFLLCYSIRLLLPRDSCRNYFC
jgi:hypothetical protein